jgi:hypothetical protein
MPERNVTEEEAAIMLRLAKEGVPAWDLDRRVAEEITARKCIWKNADFTGRDYESTNIVACIHEGAPKDGLRWVPGNETSLRGLIMLHRQAGVEYWGYL